MLISRTRPVLEVLKGIALSSRIPAYSWVKVMPIVKVNEKGRIQLPREVRHKWGLKPKQLLIVEIRKDEISLKKAHVTEPTRDPLLHDIIVRPGHSKVKVASKLLRKLKAEAWTP